MSRYRVQLEPWSDPLWDELRPLAEDHFEEVDGGVEPRRKFRLDNRAMHGLQSAGMLRVFVARESVAAVGYYTWNVMPDVESEGLLIALQGAWYVAPGHPRASHELFTYARASLKREGVQCIFPHHRTQGRGKGIGRFFKRQGAKPIQTSYVLWIGEAHA